MNARWAPDTAPEAARLVDAVARAGRARERVLGFPAATDLDYRHTADLLAGLINNLGDPDTPGRWPVHVLDLEREVIALAVALFGGWPEDWWGYVTAGGSSEGVLHGLWLGRERFPDAVVYARVDCRALLHCEGRAPSRPAHGSGGSGCRWADAPGPTHRRRAGRSGGAAGGHDRDDDDRGR